MNDAEARRLPLDRLWAEALKAHRGQDWEQAGKLYRVLLMRAPSAPFILHQYGILLHQCGEADRARELLSRAERLAPEQTEFLLDHARVLCEQGREQSALERLDRLLAVQPDSVDAIRESANLLARAGQYGEACARLEDGLARHPGEYPLWLFLGDLRQQAGDPEAALRAWEEVRKAPGEAGTAALMRIGNHYLLNAVPDEAEAVFREAIANNGDTAHARNGLAAAASQRGDFEAQAREARAALDLDPLYYRAWYQLALGPGGDLEALAGDMRAAAGKAGRDPQAWLLYMALGRVLEQLGRYDAAFDAFSEAQRRRAAEVGDDFAQELNRLEQTRNVLGAAFMARRARLDSSDARPVFIVGMPRSGTTLVEAILGAHPGMVAAGEMRFLANWFTMNVDPAYSRSLPEWLANAPDPALAHLAQAWPDVMAASGGERGRVSDKYPENFALLGLIDLVFPNASIVHVHRDPRDTCISCFTTAMTGRGVPSATTLFQLGRYYSEYEKTMAHWRRVLGEERIIEVEYERLVESPESSVRKLLEDVGLEWDAHCLEPHTSGQPVATASVYQVRQPIHSHSIGRWRRYESHLAPLNEGLCGSSR